MVNVPKAVSGGILEYGSNMDSNKILQDWLNARQRRLCSLMGESFKSSGSEIVPVGNILLEDVNIQINNGDMDFNHYINTLLMESKQEEAVSSLSDWLSHSVQMTEVAKLMSSSEQQRLLALALSTTLGKPLRYCIQHDILPSIAYWNYCAENLSTNFNQKLDLQNDVTIIIVEPTDQPILDICRAICPISRRGKKIILLPVPKLTLPCLILAEMIKKCGLDCSVYIGNSDVIVNVDTSYQSKIDIIFSGCHKRAQDFLNLSYNLQLNPVGKKVVIAMETGDCDAAVDAAITSLKASVSSSSGLYMIAHDSLLDDIKWRLRDRLARCKVGHNLDKTADIFDHSEFVGSKEVIDYLERTNLDVTRVGNAVVVFNAQPSLPLTQMDNIGQTLLILSYRRVTELASILGNISNLSELSLWVDHQGTAWEIINPIQAQRVWVNGIGIYEPGFDQLIPIQQNCAVTKPVKHGQTNTELYPHIDALRVAQRNWASQGKRNMMLTQFLKQLLVDEHFSSIQDAVLELIQVVKFTTKGNMIDGSTKQSTVFNLRDPVGLVAIIDAQDNNLVSVLRGLVMALLKGNAVVLCSDAELKSTVEFTKVAKKVGFANVIFSCLRTEKNVRALMKHHAVKRIINFVDREETNVSEPELQSIWFVDDGSCPDMEKIVNYVTLCKRVWMAIGDGLGN